MATALHKSIDGWRAPCFLVPMTSSNPDIEVLSATPAEVGEVAPLFDAYRQFYGKPADVEAARRFLFARLSKGESVVFFARYRGHPVGFLQLYPVFSSVGLARQWILNDLFVTPEARKLGVGRVLMERSRRLGEETRANALTLETASDNVAAQRLYESLGWKRDDQFYRYSLPL